MTGTPNPDPIPPIPGQLPLLDGDLTEQEAAVRAELDRLMALRDQGVIRALEYVRGNREKLAEYRQQLDQAVADARRRGATWQQVADAAGMTRPAAWERWNRG